MARGFLTFIIPLSIVRNSSP